MICTLCENDRHRELSPVPRLRTEGKLGGKQRPRFLLHKKKGKPLSLKPVEKNLKEKTDWHVSQPSAHDWKGKTFPENEDFIVTLMWERKRFERLFRSHRKKDARFKTLARKRKRN